MVTTAEVSDDTLTVPFSNLNTVPTVGAVPLPEPTERTVAYHCAATVEDDRIPEPIKNWVPLNVNVAEVEPAERANDVLVNSL